MKVTSAPPDLRQITERIEAQFKDLPGMRLTEAQVRRLCNVSDEACEAALETMVERGKLARDPGGRYRCRTSPR
jgi:hypothetical protein